MVSRGAVAPSAPRWLRHCSCEAISIQCSSTQIHNALRSHYLNKKVFCDCLKRLYGKPSCPRSVGRLFQSAAMSKIAWQVGVTRNVQPCSKFEPSPVTWPMFDQQCREIFNIDNDSTIIWNKSIYLNGITYCGVFHCYSHRPIECYSHILRLVGWIRQ